MNRSTVLSILLLAASAASVLIGCEFLQPPPESQTATLKITINGGGTVVADPKPDQNGSYQKGASVKLTAVDTQGDAFFNFVMGIQGPFGKDILNCWIFSKWEGDASGSLSTVTVVMDGDKNVTADFTHNGVKKVTISPAPAIGIATTVLTYDSSGRLARTDDFDSTNVQLYYTIYDNNAAGQVTQYINYYPDGSLYSGSQWPMVAAIMKQYYSSSGALSKVEFYNASVLITNYMEFGFNSAGRVTTMTWFDTSQSRATQRADYLYNESGRFSELEYYRDDYGTGWSYGGSYVMEYDSNGAFARFVMYDNSDTLYQYMTVSNDTSGMPAKLEMYSGSGLLLTTYFLLWQSL